MENGSRNMSLSIGRHMWRVMLLSLLVVLLGCVCESTMRWQELRVRTKAMMKFIVYEN